MPTQEATAHDDNTLASATGVSTLNPICGSGDKTFDCNANSSERHDLVHMIYLVLVLQISCFRWWWCEDARCEYVKDGVESTYNVLPMRVCGETREQPGDAHLRIYYETRKRRSFSRRTKIRSIESHFPLLRKNNCLNLNLLLQILIAQLPSPQLSHLF